MKLGEIIGKETVNGIFVIKWYDKQNRTETVIVNYLRGRNKKSVGFVSPPSGASPGGG